MKKTLPFLLLLLVLGCGPTLNVEKVVNLKVGEPQTFTIDPIAKAQTIKVSAKASSGKCTVLVVLEKDLGDADKSLALGKATDKVIASQFKTDDASVQALIPAKETAVIMVAPAEGKAAEVKLKISN